MDWSCILANAVFTFHLGLVLFSLFAPLCNTPDILLLHLSWCICVIVHWMANNDTCSLSVFEAQLRGIRYDEGFMHKFIAPVYDISKSDWILVCYIVTVFVGVLSLYKLWTIYKNDGILPMQQLIEYWNRAGNGSVSLRVPGTLETASADPSASVGPSADPSASVGPSANGTQAPVENK